MSNKDIFVEDGSKIVAEAVRSHLTEGKQTQKSSEMTICDFDDVHFRLTIKGTKLTLQAAIPNYAQLAQLSNAQPLSEIGELLTQASSGFDVALTFDNENLPEPAENIVTKLSCIRRIVQGAPLARSFVELSSKPAEADPTTPMMRYDWRPHESIFIVPQRERVLVVLSLDFEADTDQVLARTFIQEFVETNRTVNGAPPVSFSRTPPPELRPLNLPVSKPVRRKGSAYEAGAGTSLGSDREGIAGYVSFTIFPSHVQTEEKRAKAISLLLGFRTYLLFHLKAAKTYLHMRMRLRVSNLLQVLNRARPDVESERKTASGRTFRRPS